MDTIMYQYQIISEGGFQYVQTSAYRDANLALQAIHLAEHGRHERALPTAELAHHCHQRTFPHTQVDAATHMHSVVLSEDLRI